MLLTATCSILRAEKQFVFIEDKKLVEDVDVQQGLVLLLDKQGNAEIDEAVDLGRRHQYEVLIDARRRLLGARSHWWYPNHDLFEWLHDRCCQGPGQS